MTAKVVAEGSIWSIPDSEDANPVEFCETIAATKATMVASGVWRLYFPPGMTPSEVEMGRRTEVEMGRRTEVIARTKALVAPSGLVEVTPMWREPVVEVPVDPDLTEPGDNAMIDIQPNGGEN